MTEKRAASPTEVGAENPRLADHELGWRHPSQLRAHKEAVRRGDAGAAAQLRVLFLEENPEEASREWLPEETLPSNAPPVPPETSRVEELDALSEILGDFRAEGDELVIDTEKRVEKNKLREDIQAIFRDVLKELPQADAARLEQVVYQATLPILLVGKCSSLRHALSTRPAAFDMAIEAAVRDWRFSAEPPDLRLAKCRVRPLLSG